MLIPLTLVAQARLTQRRRPAQARQSAHGRATALAIGIDDYSSSSGFAPLTTCRNDALGLANRFRDIPQLGADPDAITALVSRGTPAPSRGEIIGALMKHARQAAAGDRLIVFFSGHVHQIAGDPELYLVPQDAYSDTDPTCLVALSQLAQILSRSPASHKLLLLDASHTPHFSDSISIIDSFKILLRANPGITVLAAPPEDGAAAAPSPQHSRFAAHLLPALQGSTPEALDERRLTLSSLFKFLSTHSAPIFHEADGDSMVLADFSGPLLPPDSLDLDGKRFDTILLSARARQISIKDILTSLSRTTYTQSYLEERANAALGAHLEAEFGKKASRLRIHFKWASADVSVDDGFITFPGGHYQPRYEATGKLHGALVETLSLSPVWLDRPGILADLLACLDLDPEQISFTFRNKIAPDRCIPGLEANSWQMTSELPRKIEAHRDGCALILEPESLTLSGLPLRALFAATPDKHAVRTAAAALAIFGAR